MQELGLPSFGDVRAHPNTASDSSAFCAVFVFGENIRQYRLLHEPRPSIRSKSMARWRMARLSHSRCRCWNKDGRSWRLTRTSHLIGKFPRVTPSSCDPREHISSINDLKIKVAPMRGPFKYCPCTTYLERLSHEEELIFSTLASHSTFPLSYSQLFIRIKFRVHDMHSVNCCSIIHLHLKTRIRTRITKRKASC